MKAYIIVIFFVSFLCDAQAQENNGQLLDKLSKVIDQSSKYDIEKLKRIDVLKASFEKEKANDRFNGLLDLYNEYYIFNYDSAFTYAKRLQQTAIASGDSGRMAYAKIKLSFILLSSGLFKEVFDSLRTLHLDDLSIPRKAEYYTLMARCYYDLADYVRDNIYSPAYNQMANNYIDSSLKLYADTSFEFIYYNGLKNIRSGNKEVA